MNQTSAFLDATQAPMTWLASVARRGCSFVGEVEPVSMGWARARCSAQQPGKAACDLVDFVLAADQGWKQADGTAPADGDQEPLFVKGKLGQLAAVPVAFQSRHQTLAADRQHARRSTVGAR